MALLSNRFRLKSPCQIKAKGPKNLGGFQITGRFLNKYGCVIGFLLLWETLSRLEIINPIFFPPFSAVVKTIITLFINGTMAEHLGLSLFRALSGFIIAVIVGVPLGIALGAWMKRLAAFLELPLELFSQVNPFLLFHIILLFMGLGETTKVTIVAWTCLWPILYSSMTGARTVSPILLKAGRAFGLSRFGLTVKIIIPAASPVIMNGLRLSLGYSLFMLVAAEMMGSSSGLGWLVLRSQEAFQLNKMYAAVAVIALLGLALDFILELLSHKFKYESLINTDNN
jgi:NitT/TauT family transport system permease protein